MINPGKSFWGGEEMFHSQRDTEGRITVGGHQVPLISGRGKGTKKVGEKVKEITVQSMARRLASGSPKGLYQ